MLIDTQGRFITQRKYARMTLLDIREGDDHWQVSAPGQPLLMLPKTLADGESVQVRVWNDHCTDLMAGVAYDQWFSAYLGVDCRLVYMPDSTQRLVDAQYAQQQEIVSFADGFPLLLISEASLQDLNSRLNEPVPMQRFRPNIVVSGCDAFAEDAWREIRIGEARLNVVKPCSRCVMTTVDTQTAERGEEPLKTLKTYRERNGEVFFGQNVLPQAGVTIALNDQVEICS
jgi:uncharacterized protein YcbX